MDKYDRAIDDILDFLLATNRSESIRLYSRALWYVQDAKRIKMELPPEPPKRPLVLSLNEFNEYRRMAGFSTITAEQYVHFLDFGPEAEPRLHERDSTDHPPADAKWDQVLGKWVVPVASGE